MVVRKPKKNLPEYNLPSLCNFDLTLVGGNISPFSFVSTGVFNCDFLDVFNGETDGDELFELGLELVTFFGDFEDIF